MNKEAKYRMMVVDDDEITNFIIKKLTRLSDFFYEPIIRQNGRLALDYLLEAHSRQNFPEIIILDLRMPVLDGFGFLKEYQDIWAKIYSHTKIFIFSSHKTPEAQTHIAQYDFVRSFLMKKHDSSLLLHIIKEIQAE